jgi:hypothetical protein
MRALERLPLLPSAIIFSGNGLHVYWLFDAPVTAQTHQPLVDKWQQLIKDNLIDEATGKKFDLDTTQDVARVLRIPGTTNSKGGKDVKIITLDDSKRYRLATIDAVLQDIEIAPIPASDKKAVSIVLDPECTEPACIGQLRKSPRFRETWEHKRDDLRDQSLSAYDLSLASLAARKKCSDQEICDLLVVHRRQNGDDEKLHRLDYFQNTIAKARASLAESKSRIDDLFRQYAYVLSEKRFYDRETLQDMDKEQFADKTARILGSRDAPNEFLERRDTLLLDSVTYLVNGGEVVTEGSYRNLNLWDGYRTNPKAGDVKIFLDHMDYLFGDDVVAKNHMLDLMAHYIQHPDIKVLHAPLIIGDEGIGKSVLGAIVQGILGPGNVKAIDNSELKSQYTDWLRNTAVVVVEELMTLGRREIMNTLKPLITQREARIHRKYVATVTMLNRVNFIFFSNYIDAAKLDKGDRRYFVFISIAEPRDPSYYDTLFNFIESEDGIAAIAHYLQSRDLSKFNPNSRPPMTEGKKIVIQESLSPLEATLHMLYEDEQEPFHKDLLSVQDIIQFFRIYTHMRDPNPNAITRFLRGIGAKNLGQKRIRDKKVRLWAIRRPEPWSQATEKTIEEYLYPCDPRREAFDKAIRAEVERLAHSCPDSKKRTAS